MSTSTTPKSRGPAAGSTLAILDQHQYFHALIAIAAGDGTVDDLAAVMTANPGMNHAGMLDYCRKQGALILAIGAGRRLLAKHKSNVSSQPPGAGD